MGCSVGTRTAGRTDIFEVQSEYVVDGWSLTRSQVPDT